MDSADPPGNEVCFVAARARKLTSILGERIAKAAFTQLEIAVSPAPEYSLLHQVRNSVMLLTGQA